MSIINELLAVSLQDKRKAREIFNKTEEDIQKDLEILLEWLEKQPHLPKPHDKTRLEAALLRNKFRIERTKIKLDKYYTYRGVHADFLTNLDPESTAIKNLQKSFIDVIMPELPPTMERIHFMKFVENQEDIFVFKDLVTFELMLLDLQLSHDYSVGERFIVDGSTITMKYILKMDLNSMAKGWLLSQEAFSGRLLSIDYFNIPPIMDYVLTILKQIMNPKLFERVKIHHTLESLYSVVPKKYLPKDYGGDQEALDVLHEKWSKELIYQKDFLLANAKRISNEKLRIGEPIHNDLFGLDGTFKKINID